MGGFEDKVRGVLSDTMNLPDDFLSMIPQYVAQNPVPSARVSGTRITSGRNTAAVSTTGATFGTGQDLVSLLSFTADGKSDYVIRATFDGWSNTGAANANFLYLNLDGAENGFVAVMTAPGASYTVPGGASGLIVKPAAGSHTASLRLVVTAGTGTVNGGTGGPGQHLPILVTLEVV